MTDSLVMLFHSAAIDDGALAAALRSEAGYIGALGPGEIAASIIASAIRRIAALAEAIPIGIAAA